jgi:hypothetical protein
LQGWEKTEVVAASSQKPDGERYRNTTSATQGGAGTFSVKAGGVLGNTCAGRAAIFRKGLAKSRLFGLASLAACSRGGRAGRSGPKIKAVI